MGDQEVRSTPVKSKKAITKKKISSKRTKKKKSPSPLPSSEDDSDSGSDFQDEQGQDEDEDGDDREEKVDDDEEEEEEEAKKTPRGKAKAKSKAKPSKNSKKNTQKSESSEDEGENSDDEVFDENNVKKSKIVIPRPKGSPFADAISPDTLEFLAELAVNNDRDFMRLRAKEWAAAKKDFTDLCSLLMTEIHQADPTTRVEEAKHAVYRQNRDLRFSNDKSPYKRNLSASFSRTGRKFADAGYHISIKPNNESMVGIGMWQPDSTRLANMRSSIIRHGDLLREALSTDALKEVFDGKFGTAILSDEDKLKVAPKNIAKDHPEIELLRYRSFAIVKRFTDEEVVSEGFLDKVMDVIEASVPFVAVVNSWI
ncbi:hypothetical protein HMPREF1544_05056 [Mucor circinelloides 1006PhL]|uniref:TIGR02453 family protein n=1 Tax=Mucor circinelloides f. circinelloides (strain 1006PhL) TaxID=1220926 RepID=S2JHV9_MUCC1|nr:hypothetical protein HMPREF1544_05056 [Mucor circinelloides 1006PhL]